MVCLRPSRLSYSSRKPPPGSSAILAMFIGGRDRLAGFSSPQIGCTTPALASARTLAARFLVGVPLPSPSYALAARGSPDRHRRRESPPASGDRRDTWNDS